MIRLTSYADKTVAVFGLGGSGRASAHALVAGGARVACWDDHESARDMAKAENLDVVDLAASDWASFDCLLLAPGVPLTHPAPHWTVGRASTAGIPVVGDVALFLEERRRRFPNVPVVAITGTNGKSTTTALTAHLVAALGRDAQIGGNIGRAVLTLDEPSEATVFVLELSSYQIDLAPKLDVTVGVLLNVTPDHLDRHGSLASYAGIKARLPREAEVAAVCLDDSFTAKVARELESSSKLIAFTAGQGAAQVPDLYAIRQTLFVHVLNGAYASSQEIASLDGIESLRGGHNVENALAALASIRALDTAARQSNASGEPLWKAAHLAKGLTTFPGLAHRLEQVGKANGVGFVNDSKATNAEAAEKALLAFDDGIHWIVGGVPKAGGIDMLEPLFGRVRRAYLIGESSAAFEKTLNGKVETVGCGGLAAAVSAAYADARAWRQRGVGREPVVLLSPACASFDQYRNFEVRGDAFKAIVRGLPDFEAPTAREPLDRDPSDQDAARTTDGDPPACT